MGLARTGEEYDGWVCYISVCTRVLLVQLADPKTLLVVVSFEDYRDQLM